MATGKDSLKVVVVGNEQVGKTALIQQLLKSSGDAALARKRSSTAVAPIFHCSKPIDGTEKTGTSSSMSSMSSISSSRSASVDESSPLVGLDMYEWNLTDEQSQSNLEKITVWDFSGKESFHAAQGLFFTPETLYVVVWDMAASSIRPLPQQRCTEGPPPPCTFGSSKATSSCTAAFSLGYDSDSDDDCDMDMYNQEEVRKHKRSLDRDIDEKVQSWIDRIQCKVPGATILPVATFADRFFVMDDDKCAEKEIKKRCRSLKERLLCNEDVRIQDLKYRIQADASCKGGPHKETCRWVQSVAVRPKILFGSQEEEYGETLPHHIHFKNQAGLHCFREFLLSKARTLANAADFPPQVSSIRDIWCNVSRHFKVIQTKHFPHNIKELSDDDLSAVLECLHRSGELCYFPRTIGGTVSDLIVLDPAWLVESVDFVLRNAIKESAAVDILTDPEDGGSQSLQDEIRTMWTSRPSTQLGLKLALQVSKDIPDEIFSCILNQLVHHDVVASLSDHKGPRDLFVPSTLAKRNFHEGCDPTCVVNCPLLHLGAAGLFSQSLCHALTFLECVPSKLLERIAVQIIRTLESCDTTVSKVSIKKFHCWSDSFVLELEMTADGQHRHLEIQSFLLRAREDDDVPCYAVCNKSMFVTCMRESQDGHRIGAWKPICVSLRKAMQRGLDELPGAEYKDEGVCPECLTKKSVGEIGTWPFSKIQSILDEDETTIRCRNGHCVDISMVQGLICCELGQPKPDFSCCVPKQVQPVATSAVTEADVVFEEIPQDPVAKLHRSASDNILKIERCAPVTRSQTVPSSVTAGDHVDPATAMKLEAVKKAVQEYEASTKKRFFGIKKAKLRLDNLQLRESHLPLEELIDTPLGENLQHLSLSGNLFETLPSCLVLSLPNLKSLDLSGCCFKMLPEKWHLPKLKKLNLSSNMLSSFPGDAILTGMPELEELNLSGNKITRVRLPSDPLSLSKLKTLDLSMNKISKLPNDLGRLTSLKMFDVQHNPVKHVPVDILSSMNSFFIESVKEPTSSTGGKTGRFGRKTCTGGKARDSLKQISLARDTQYTAPFDESSVFF
jgi:GTPase SAR1 family protein